MGKASKRRRRSSRRQPPPDQRAAVETSPAGQPASTTASPAPARDLLGAAGLTLLAWVHRLAFLHSSRDRDWPFTVFYEGDSETFFRYARALLAGELYDSGIPFHPPGFAHLLAWLHQILGAGHGVREIPHLSVKAGLALLSSLAVGLLYLLLRPYLGRAAALLASLLAAWHFGLQVIAIAPVSEGLYLTLLSAALLLWSRGLRHPLQAPDAVPRLEPLAGLGLGVLLGALALVRAEGLLVGALLGAVGLAGALRATDRGRRLGWRLVPWALVLLGTVAVLTPWTLRNARILDEINTREGAMLAEPLPTFVPLTLYGPLNLALANHAEADGTFSRRVMSSLERQGQLVLADPQHLRFLLHGDRMAWDYIRGAPLDWGALVLSKWGLFLDAWRLGFTQWSWPGGLAGTRRPVDIFVPDGAGAAWTQGVLLTLAVIAVPLLWRREPGRRWLGIVAILYGSSLATTAFFFGYARLGLLVLPFGLGLVASTLVELGRKLPLSARRWRIVALVAVLTVLAVELSGWDAERNFRATGTTLPGSSKLNRDLPVTLEPWTEEADRATR